MRENHREQSGDSNPMEGRSGGVGAQAGEIAAQERLPMAPTVATSGVTAAGAAPPALPLCTRIIPLRTTELTPESFAPYGQLIDPQLDGGKFGPDDAQLDLSRGIPRFYIMRLQNRTLKFGAITHHAKTTQCLGSALGLPWYLGVAPATIIGATERTDSKNCSQVLKGDGYDYLPPAVEDVRLFRVEGPRFLKLHVGTWHAGPLFEESCMDFYSLELSNTNEVDHTTYSFKKGKDVVFEVDNP